MPHKSSYLYLHTQVLIYTLKYLLQDIDIYTIIYLYYNSLNVLSKWYSSLKTN
ncbi:hypothetical protein RchiOBHm_Chr3g0467471 [Rosa chinensis]|uniref:Uncharacterized protein n=1 Tax=Rosa chinensis TaxID=74649 RepID=A0A2P6RA83_ROSCH|nr:hypothetical protein RchiOBHm_Chr3g0467471 [Rosa chinensis]